MSKACIQFEKVSKTFDLRLLYRDVSFSLYPSNVVLLTGKNGAGKSTLLRMAAGLISPSQGKAECFVLPEKCAYLGHATFIYPQLSALENLLFWSKALGKRDIQEKECLNMLKKVRLEKFAHDSAGIFSRGMAQRLNIARILLQDPDFLMLDEPSTGLDTESKELFYDSLQAFKQKNACILWVSHDLTADSLHATHHLHIENKRVLFQDSLVRENVNVPQTSNNKNLLNNSQRSVENNCNHSPQEANKETNKEADKEAGEEAKA